MYLAINIPLLFCLGFAGFAPVSLAVVLTTKTHCILVSSRGVNRQTLCPGSSLDVDPQVEIIAGFDENSKREPTGVPLWQESFVIQPRIKVDIPLPTYSQDMPTAYWGDDNCLYAPIQIYPTLFPAPPVVFGFNSNDQQIGCANKQYVGAAIANPWHIGNYGTDNPTKTNPSRLGDSLLDRVFWNHLKNPNNEYYNDRRPLFDKSEKSDAGTSSSGAVADADPSWFNSDVSAFDLSGGSETASLLPLDPPADSETLGNFVSSTSDLNSYDLFAPSSDGSSDLADWNPAGGTVGLDPLADFGALGNVASSGDDLTNYDLFASSSDGSSNAGNDELFASLDSGTGFAGDDVDMFARRRFRRSSRVFRW